MCSPCKDLERRFGSGDCKCKHYREQFPDCHCEGTSVSDHSPGPVEAEEWLVRVLYSPHHLNKETGQPTPAALGDAAHRGLSCNRQSYISEPDLRARIEAKIAADAAAGKRSDAFWLVVRAQCSAIRSITQDSGEREFCIYDTALETDMSHADVCQERVSPDSLRKKIRKRLAAVFGNPSELSGIYLER